MELNREQIVKALEFCTGIKKLDACANCPAHLGCNDCVDFLREESLALIKELTEENEFHRKTISKNAQIALNVAVDEIEKTKADTVRKMQERLEERIDQTIQVFDFQISECNAVRQALRGVKNDINQIAKEMLED